MVLEDVPGQAMDSSGYESIANLDDTACSLLDVPCLTTVVSGVSLCPLPPAQYLPFLSNLSAEDVLQETETLPSQSDNDLFGSESENQSQNALLVAAAQAAEVAARGPQAASPVATQHSSGATASSSTLTGSSSGSGVSRPKEIKEQQSKEDDGTDSDERKRRERRKKRKEEKARQAKEDREKEERRAARKKAKNQQKSSESEARGEGSDNEEERAAAEIQRKAAEKRREDAEDETWVSVLTSQGSARSDGFDPSPDRIPPSGQISDRRSSAKSNSSDGEEHRPRSKRRDMKDMQALLGRPSVPPRRPADVQPESPSSKKAKVGTPLFRVPDVAPRRASRPGARRIAVMSTTPSPQRQASRRVPPVPRHQEGPSAGSSRDVSGEEAALRQLAAGIPVPRQSTTPRRPRREASGTVDLILEGVRTPGSTPGQQKKSTSKPNIFFHTTYKKICQALDEEEVPAYKVCPYCPRTLQGNRAITKHIEAEHPSEWATHGAVGTAVRFYNRNCSALRMIPPNDVSDNLQILQDTYGKTWDALSDAFKRALSTAILRILFRAGTIVSREANRSVNPSEADSTQRSIFKLDELNPTPRGRSARSEEEKQERRRAAVQVEEDDEDVGEEEDEQEQDQDQDGQDDQVSQGDDSEDEPKDLDLSSSSEEEP